MRPNGLVPGSPEDARALYRLIAEELNRSVIGRSNVVARLALAGARHLAADSHAGLTVPERILLIGPSGTGKTHVANALAEALGVPSCLMAADTMAELNWAGTDVADFLGQLYRRTGATLSPAGEELALRAVVIIDDIDKLRLPGRYSSEVTAEYQRGRQLSLLQVIGDGSVTFNVDGRTFEWSSRRALVIACGAFPGLLTPDPTAEDLVDWGVVPDLAERLCAGSVIRLEPLAFRDTVTILERSAASLVDRFRIFGVRLEVSREVLEAAAAAIVASGGILGVRSGLARLAAGAELGTGLRRLSPDTGRPAFTDQGPRHLERMSRKPTVDVERLARLVSAHAGQRAEALPVTPAGALQHAGVLGLNRQGPEQRIADPSP